jgi:SlyX protein
MGVESSMAFLEKTVEDLSDVVRRQQEDIDRLETELRVVKARLEHVESPETDEPEPATEKPPHY